MSKALCVEIEKWYISSLVNKMRNESLDIAGTLCYGVINDNGGRRENWGVLVEFSKFTPPVTQFVNKVDHELHTVTKKVP